VDDILYTPVLFGAAMAAHDGRLNDIDTLCRDASGIDAGYLLGGGIGCVCELLEHAEQATGIGVTQIAGALTSAAASTELGDAIVAVVAAAVAFGADDDAALHRHFAVAAANPLVFIALATVMNALLAEEAARRGVPTSQWISARCISAAGAQSN
jgi:uncharacterized membrane protein YhhN